MIKLRVETLAPQLYEAYVRKLRTAEACRWDALPELTRAAWLWVAATAIAQLDEGDSPVRRWAP